MWRLSEKETRGSARVTSEQFRVVCVRDEDADDGYRLYITNLPSDEFSPAEVSALYRARWSVELLFRELKSRYELGSFQSEKAYIVRIQVLAALLTLVVSRAILRAFVDHATTCGDGATFPPERWAPTFRSVALLVLIEIAVSYGYPRPNLSKFLYFGAQQPAPSRTTLLGKTNAELCSGSSLNRIRMIQQLLTRTRMSLIERSVDSG